MYAFSDTSTALQDRMRAFMAERVIPALPLYEAQHAGGNRWAIPPVLEALKAEAKREGLWNLFMPPAAPGTANAEDYGPGLSNLDYAPLAEIMGRVEIAAEVFNCNAPDSGNMELLHHYATDAQKARWLDPLLRGEIRSAFLMTEPDVACSDATNVQTRIVRDGDDLVINGTKWWITNAGDPRCALYIVMGKTDPDGPVHAQQSMVLVPADTPGLSIKRMLTVFGYDDAPHGHAEIELRDVRVTAANLVLGEGRGFEIAQGRLGPGRIHHCMRVIGAAEVALELMIDRLSNRETFGKPLIERSIWQHRIARARTKIDMCRLLTLQAADSMDRHGNKVARKQISMIKIAAPEMATYVVDMAIQAFGSGGLSSDTRLPKLFAGIRSLRFADGPDEVHDRTVARLEIRDRARARDAGIL